MEFQHYITLGGVLSPLVTIVVGTLLAWALKRIDNKASAAGVDAKLAAERSAPTGNGYAGRTEQALEDVQEALRSIGKDIGGLRSDHRATARRLDRFGERLDKHLDKEK